MIQGIGANRLSNTAGINAFAGQIAERSPAFARRQNAALAVLPSTGRSSATGSSGEKKDLHYNYKGMSSQLMRVKTSMAAATIAARAGVQVKDLYAKLQSGEYDAEEVLEAIVHAEQIELAAIRRRDNLRMEEELARKAKSEEQQELIEMPSTEMMEKEIRNQISQETLDEMKKEIQKQLEEELQKALQEEMNEEMQKEMEDLLGELQESGMEEMPLDELTEAMTGKMRPEELEELKKKHRSEELMAIEKADMAYLKMRFQRLARQKAAAGLASAGGGASFHASAQPTASYTPAAVSVTPPAPSGAAIDVSG